jgi:hypothetical protein
MKRPATSRALAAELERGARRLQSFTGRKAEPLATVEAPRIPKVGLVVGTCDGILYTTVRDGREEKYIHKFKASDKPMMVVSPNGSQIFLIGGRFRFTERGIVDASDRSG